MAVQTILESVHRWRQWHNSIISIKPFFLAKKSRTNALIEKTKDAELYFILLERAVGWAFTLRIVPVTFDAKSKAFVVPQMTRSVRAQFFVVWTLASVRGAALFVFLFTNWKLYQDFFVDGIMSIDHVMGGISGTATGTVFVSSFLISQQSDVMFRNLNLIPRAQGHFTDLFGQEGGDFWNVVIWKVRWWLIGAYVLIPSTCFVTLFCYLGGINLAAKLSSHMAVLVDIGIFETLLCLLFDLYATAFTISLLYFGLMTMTTNLTSYKYLVLALENQPEDRTFDVLYFYKYVYAECHIMNQAFRKYTPATVFILLGVAAMNYQVVNVNASLTRFGVLAYCAFCMSVVVSFGLAYSVGTVLSEAVSSSGKFLANKKFATPRQVEFMPPEERLVYRRITRTLQPLTINYVFEVEYQRLCRRNAVYQFISKEKWGERDPLWRLVRGNTAQNLQYRTPYNL